jgi:hypothetical protein
LLVAVGCAATGPSPELIDARRAYDEARASNAATYSPDKLLTAKQAQGLLEDGKDDEARLVLMRADADAEVALMITREAQTSANVQKARADVDGLQNRNQ